MSKWINTIFNQDTQFTTPLPDKNFLSCISKETRILDIGCGYGFLSYMLALTGPLRVVKGIDYDSVKIKIANQGYLRSQSLKFEQVNALNYSFESYEGIVLSDVLHYLQPSEQELLMENCFKSLSQNGILLIREGMSDQQIAHRGTRLTEIFSTQILGFNKTAEKGLSFISSAFIYAMGQKYNMEVSTVAQARYTSNALFVLKKKG